MNSLEFSQEFLNRNTADDLSKKNGKDKKERATVELVLDPRTRIILFKLINSRILNKVYGCISTGKEANVYHAKTSLAPSHISALSTSHQTLPLTLNSDSSQQVTNEPSDNYNVAIKIYKTSILVFKDRDRYVSGEFRFRHGYNKSNPRKMVKTWAEKEMRNLKRMVKEGIPAPEPILLKSHVLLMSFIGSKNGIAAPRLKDAIFKDEIEIFNAYSQILKNLWRLYHSCKLVHADLSEYNLLYYRKTVYFIDVSQSVEHDHPHALEFLRKDCMNVIEFFSKRIVSRRILSLKKLYDFLILDVNGIKLLLSTYSVSNSGDTLELLDSYFDLAHSETLNHAENEQEDSIFSQIYIPRSLNELPDVEKVFTDLKLNSTEVLLIFSYK
jgi:RIO kinase 1